MRRRQLLLGVLLALACAGMFTGCNCGSNPVAPVLPPLSAVVLPPPVDTLVVGTQHQFAAQAFDTNGTVVGGAAFTWTTGDPNVITVSSTGRVTAVGEGVTTLVASAGGKADTSTVATFVQQGWYAQSSSTTIELFGVYCRPDGRNGWAVGDAGTIVHSADAGVSWSTQTSSTSFNLRGVNFTSNQTGFAVGFGGTIMRTTDGGG